MGTLLLLLAGQTPVISEVCANPLNEASGEFVELYNPGPGPFSVSGCSITDGDALDYLFAWNEAAHGQFPGQGVVLGNDTIPPGGWAVVLELGYLLDPCYDPAPGTVILTTGDNALCNGLAASSDPLTLFGPGGTGSADVLSTYGTPVDSDAWQDRDDDGLDGIPFDPGNGLSVHRVPLGAPDAQGNWQGGAVTPGAGPGGSPDTSAVLIQGIWPWPGSPEPGQSCLLYASFLCQGTVPPSQGDIGLFLDMNGDSLPGPGEPSASWPAGILQPGCADTLSLQFTAPEKGWYVGCATAPEAFLDVPVATGGGVAPVITEVMANPWEQATQEFIEVFYPGPGVFRLAGCRFTDGDAVDLVIPWSGTSLIPGGSCGVILDPDYAGGHPIPQDARLFTVENSSLGNGLANSDPIVLYDWNGTMIANILSTAGTPIISDDPLECDDDGLDGIPFNPGQGFSMERMNPCGPDTGFNWAASGAGGTPGWLGEHGLFPDLSADTVDVPPAVDPGVQFTARAVFSSAGSAAAHDCWFTLFNDLDGDGLPGPGEVLSSQWTECLEPGETLFLEGTLLLPEEGFYLIAGLAQCPEDTVSGNDLGYAQVMCGEGVFPVITEVLCNPSDQARDEFVELYFPGPGVLDPSLLSISDGDATDQLSGDLLTPGCYGLILDPDYFSGSMPYAVPPGTPLIFPGNSAIGDGLAGSDPVLLLRGSTVVSSYGTPEDPDDGVPFNPGTDMSVERTLPGLPDHEENWFVNPLGPSPGGPPLGLHQGVDYGVRRLSVSPPGGEPGCPVTATAVVESMGSGQCAFSVVLYAAGSVVATVSPPPPQTGDSVMVVFDWVPEAPETLLEAAILCAPDGNPRNDRKTAVWDPAPGLVINEIMHSPGPAAPEWVELYNGAVTRINLFGATLSDPSATAYLPEHSMEPGEYLVLCPDPQAFRDVWGDPPCPVVCPQGWPVLNNTGDTLTLSCAPGSDWVPYGPSWGGGSGVSLERRSARERGRFPWNWGSCSTGATPGRANSIGAQSGGPFLEALPEIFSPGAFPLQVTLRVPGQGFSGEVRVYDVTGRVIAELWNGPIPGETLELTWHGEGLPVGRYLLFARAKKAGDILESVLVRILARPL